MGVLKIDCYCSESIMEHAVSLVVNHLENSDINELGDVDEEFGDIRICADFNIYMDTIKLKSAEILDSDWDLLYEDTAVFTSRLKTVLESYNTARKAILKQAYELHSDQLTEFLNK